MHDRRNFGLTLLLGAGAVWAIVAWIFLGPDAPALLFQRTAATLMVVCSGAWLLYAMLVADRLPNHLKEAVGQIYYEADGVSFMPIVRVMEGHAELCVYYQNRFENAASVIIHLRPAGESFHIQEGWHDVHFAFRAGGGDFGVIRQPIHVPDELQGEVIDAQMAAASHYPRSHGTRYRREAGMSCGEMIVDWTGAAFKTGVHQVSGEIELFHPATIHLPMPNFPVEDEGLDETWRQEMIHAGDE